MKYGKTCIASMPASRYFISTSSLNDRCPTTSIGDYPFRYGERVH